MNKKNQANHAHVFQAWALRDAGGFVEQDGYLRFAVQHATSDCNFHDERLVPVEVSVRQVSGKVPTVRRADVVSKRLENVSVPVPMDPHERRYDTWKESWSHEFDLSSWRLGLTSCELGLADRLRPSEAVELHDYQFIDVRMCLTPFGKYTLERLRAEECKQWANRLVDKES